mmetsp:Transcript_2649/g.4546  ORF Transcript_2649/g.4546 Transcript_2649/m.4546 type:complete len:309 (+) Transcript_2649:130-1056(+)
MKRTMPPYSDAHTHCSDDTPTSRPLHHQNSSSRDLHRSPPSKSRSNVETRDGLLQLAAMELEAMRKGDEQRRRVPEKRGSDSSIQSEGSASSYGSTHSKSSEEEAERAFPPACLHLLHALPGNSRCIDCRARGATWASVSYGITLCLQCSGKHRGLGVNCSFIKSLTLDSWKRREILCMLEGGNEQLGNFFERHGMGTDEAPSNSGSNNSTTVGVLDRYRTKAASFYRQHLMSHARQLADGGMYEGREASRRSGKQRKVNGSKSGSSSNGKSSSPSKSGRTKKSSKEPQLPTVTEKEDAEPACGAVGA